MFHFRPSRLIVILSDFCGMLVFNRFKEAAMGESNNLVEIWPNVDIMMIEGHSNTEGF